jgi:hypothetical protein
MISLNLFVHHYNNFSNPNTPKSVPFSSNLMYKTKEKPLIGREMYAPHII